MSTQNDRTVATWAELEAEIPGLVALTSGNADTIEHIVERLGNGQRALEEALRRGSATTKIEARLDELRAMMRKEDWCWRRLAVIRAMVVLRGVAGHHVDGFGSAGVTVVAPDMEISVKAGPP